MITNSQLPNAQRAICFRPTRFVADRREKQISAEIRFHVHVFPDCSSKIRTPSIPRKIRVIQSTHHICRHERHRGRILDIRGRRAAPTPPEGPQESRLRARRARRRGRRRAIRSLRGPAGHWRGCSHINNSRHEHGVVFLQLPCSLGL